MVRWVEWRSIGIAAGDCESFFSRNACTAPFFAVRLIIVLSAERSEVGEGERKMRVGPQRLDVVNPALAAVRDVYAADNAGEMIAD
jgi:hypothetical protein